jgi:hypothetical protein
MNDTKPVGASLLAKNDDAVKRQAQKKRPKWTNADQLSLLA